MALVVAFVAAITDGQTPLNVMQLLWVNLIMDSLAALGEAALGGRRVYEGWISPRRYELKKQDCIPWMSSIS